MYVPAHFWKVNRLPVTAMIHFRKTLLHCRTREAVVTKLVCKLGGMLYEKIICYEHEGLDFSQYKCYSLKLNEIQGEIC